MFQLIVVCSFVPGGLFSNSRQFGVFSRNPHSVLLVLKSPPAMNVFPRKCTNFSNWFALRLCFGGQ
jgi:hypothetical protein